MVVADRRILIDASDPLGGVTASFQPFQISQQFADAENGNDAAGQFCLGLQAKSRVVYLSSVSVCEKLKKESNSSNPKTALSQNKMTSVCCPSLLSQATEAMLQGECWFCLQGRLFLRRPVT